MLRGLLELEEVVGRAWHRWASAAASWPLYPDAAIELEQIEGALGVFFRAAGGDPGRAVAALAEHESAHRLTLRQRLGMDAERLPAARLDADALLLPARLAFFPDPALNRLHYFWLAAQGACLRPAALAEDPLQRDLHTIAAARSAAALACTRLPGLRRLYEQLCGALLALRPVRALPPAEMAVEALIVEALGGPAAETGTDAAVRGWLLCCGDPEAPGEAALMAPRGYRPPLPVPLWPVAGADLVAARPRADVDPEPADPDAESERAAPGRRRAQRRRQDQAEREDPLVFNRFEKLLSMAEMVNVNRLVDDEKDPDAARNADQLDELTLAPHQQRAAARLRMELDLPREEAVGEALNATLTYPEWHYRSQRFLPDHCVVVAGPQETDGGEIWSPDAETRRRIRRVRRQFEALRPARRIERGQLDGADLDLDAAVRALVDRRAGGPGSDRVHLATRDSARDLAVSALVDVSLSTEAWLEDRRVIDVEKEALLVLAHGISACGDAFAVHSFTSRRREHVRVATLKDWNEPLDARVERRIGAIRPGSYTRMGTAIRHLVATLARRPERHRLLLLLTDGKPNDTDYYEGRYAIEDSRRAVLDARRAGVRVFAVTIDREARGYLPRIFGASGYCIVPRPEALATALPAIYRTLVRP